MYDPTVICMDSHFAMAIAKSPQSHDQTKHIDVKYHLMRRQVEKVQVELEYIATGEQGAGDNVTKALNREKHNKFVREMGLGRLA